MIYKIVTLPHPLLRKKIQPVKKLDKKLLQFIKNLAGTLEKQSEPEGLGIAANQVGVDERIFLVKIKEKAKVFINPEIIEFSEEKVVMTEGCLSVPLLYSQIERPSKVKIKYQTVPSNETMEQWNNEIIEDYDGLTARVIQHEQDHLNGIVFLDHALQQKAKIFRIEKNKEGKDEFVEVKI